MPTRRSFLAATAASLIVPRFAHGQARLQVPVSARTLIGVLWTQGGEASAPLWDAFTAGANAADISNGRDFTVQHAWCDNDDTKLQQYAKYLVEREAAVLLAQGGASAAALAQASRTLPIIAMTVSEAAAAELIGPDLAHPKANVTGLTLTTSQMAAGQIDIAATLAPGKRIGILSELGSAADDDFLRNAMTAATPMGVDLLGGQPTGGDYGRALTGLVAQGVGAILVPAPELAEEQRKQVVAAAKAAKVPVVFGNRLAVQKDGGLISLGGDQLSNYRRAAAMMAAVLRGAKPGDIPAEVAKPTLVVNTRVAREQGITVPVAILARAEAVE